MAVYTRLTKEEIAKHLENYPIGELVDFKEIIDGIDNSNFIIDTEKGRYILTIFESRINKEELPFFINLKLHLANKGICCPRPILNNAGESISDLKGKKSSIVSFLSGATLKPQENGYYDSITPKHCFEIGKVLAKLHEAAADFEMQRKNEISVMGFRNLFSRFDQLIEDYQKGLRGEILEVLTFLEQNWKNDLPSAAVHADLFPDNVFFNPNGQLSGVIDFYFAANDALIYDFAITVNAWCFDENNVFQEEKFNQMMSGYNEVKSFSSKELEVLKIALLAASMRFLLTRLHDMFFTPKDSLVKVKNPQEYLGKLRYFKSQLN
jgi:homoserine kinase type II